MLTSELLRVRQSGDRITPRYVVDAAAARVLPAAERMVAIVSAAVGERRERIDEALDAIGARPSDRVVVQGLRKLLLDRCDFSCSEGTEPEVVRRETFERAARARRALAPREPFDRGAVLAEVAAALGAEPAFVEARLFADLRQHEVLRAVRPITAAALLERYNVALAQGVLLRATRVLLALDGEEPGRVRQLFRAARFHGLLHRVTDAGEGRYVIEVDGPFSLFSAVQKYGLKLALFLTAVLRCQRWRLRADVVWGQRKTPMVFELGPEEGLVPHDARIAGVAPEVAKLVEGFRALDSPWDVEHNDEIIALPGEAVCAPDLRFTHRETGEVVFLEAFGFWSRKAVWQRVETIGRGFPARIILAVGKQLRVSEEVLGEDEAGELYVYGNSMRPKTILERLEAP